MHAFNQSIGSDQRLWQVDLQGSEAYVEGLKALALVSPEEATQLQQGLTQVGREWQQQKFVLHEQDEDIHSANERRLIELVGPVGGKLHTGRSRNDQVVTDMRLYLMQERPRMEKLLLELHASGVALAEKHIEVLMPGFTHLQPAQPIRWSHWILSHVAAFHRDYQVYCSHYSAHLSLSLVSIVSLVLALSRFARAN